MYAVWNTVLAGAGEELILTSLSSFTEQLYLTLKNGYRIFLS